MKLPEDTVKTVMKGNDVLPPRRGAVWRRSFLAVSRSILGDTKSKRTRHLFLVTVVALLAIHWALPPRPPRAEHGSKATFAGAIKPLEPRGALVANATELWWMLPASPLQVRGVLLAFHGCNRGGGYDFFRMPEDRVVAHQALQRGLAVVALTSQNRQSGCWSPQDAQILSTHQILDRWFELVGLPPHATNKLPLLAMGASSGGAFLFSLWKTLPIVSMAAYITRRFFDAEDLLASRKQTIPATAFVHMPRDTKTAPHVADNIQALTKAGVSTQEWKIHPHPFTPELCRRRLPEFEEKACPELLNHWTENYPDLVDPKDFSILSQPSGPQWAKAFKSAEKLLRDAETSPRLLSNDDEGGPHKYLPYPSHFFQGKSWINAMLKEEVAAAFARHEMVAEKGEEVIDWLMERAQ